MIDTQKIFAHDISLLPATVAGMDEAGRGPLAGPVVTACVVMPLDTPIDGIFDSKKVPEKKRERLYELILQTATAYGIGIAEREEIDRINILNATKKAMRAAFADMCFMPDILLVDAVKGLELPVETRSLIKGDATSYNIAAASIVAKVTRDRMMRAFDAEYPAYGFAQNKGYGTARHIAALRANGCCPLHRRTFIGNFVDTTREGADVETR